MTGTDSILLSLHRAVLADFAATKPKNLARGLQYQADDIAGAPDIATTAAFAAALAEAEPTDPIVELWRQRLTGWDYSDTPDWSKTPPNTYERRDEIYALIGVDEALQDRLSSLIPVATTDRPVIISDDFEPWYEGNAHHGRPFYWPSYKKLLETNGWSDAAIAGLDEASDAVVERISNPARDEAYQAKGLVVGYVQSGKTANFTGVIAKAIDSGYRLVIVLGGTLNMLRRQTQRRLDMELVGRENIVRNDSEIDSDYADDPAWIKGNFVSFGDYPSRLGGFDVVRMTTRDNDYKSLRQGIVALEFEKNEPALPLFDEKNLHRSSARLMVVKKNKAVLTKLVKDLTKIRTPLAEIPVLIIDDESDEASVNTRDLKKPDAQRTAINQKISDLLDLLPRAQYVGYTATPFANVFVDPSDAEDIFPKDFIISLPQPADYMGVQAFHDTGSDIPHSERTVENSNEKAYVRDVSADRDDDSALREAIDAYVLAGAMKLYREDTGYKGKTFTHHTMLIHESVKMADHRDLLIKAKRLWFDSGYFGPTGHERLRKLFKTDFKAVSAARSAGYPVPESYEELAKFVGPAVTRIGGDENPVIVVNGDKDLETGEADFDKRPIWKILIGGQKLSRGFTVEGLTISYFKRTSASASTLMQMGRWFGFREGYRDLVRLYLGRAETLGKKTVDLLDAFEAICMDEERFRGELAKYSRPGEGQQQITPAQVPPLVYQHLPWLPPVAKSKMFNARLVEISTAGQWQEPTAYPVKKHELQNNFELWRPHLEQLPSIDLTLSAPNPRNHTIDEFHAFAGSVSAEDALATFEQLKWMNADSFAPHLAYLRAITNDGKVDDWLLVAPQHATDAKHASIGSDRQFSWFSRKYRSHETQIFGAISSPRQRTALLRIAGALTEPGNNTTESLAKPKRGVIALFPLVLPDHEDGVKSSGLLDPAKTVMAFAFVAPSSARSSSGQVIRFATIDSSQDSPIIDAEHKLPN